MLGIDFSKFPGSTRLLAAKVPELCPDCDRNGWTVADIGNGDVVGLQCDHLNAPTIAKLLAIGAAVFTATPAKTTEPHYRSIR